MWLDEYHIRARPSSITVFVQWRWCSQAPIPMNCHTANARRVHTQRDVIDLIDEREIDEEMLP